MSTTRTHFTFRVDTWTPDGESIVEHVAGIEDYQVALVTYRAACQRWPGIPITLRQGGPRSNPNEIASVLGHAGARSALHYTQGADRKRMARTAMRRLIAKTADEHQ